MQFYKKYNFPYFLIRKILRKHLTINPAVYNSNSDLVEIGT